MNISIVLKSNREKVFIKLHVLAYLVGIILQVTSVQLYAEVTFTEVNSGTQGNMPVANSLTTSEFWSTSESNALTLASQQKKWVILVAGRDTCLNTTYMRNTVFQQESIKNLIDQNFVLWYSNVDNSGEFWPYASGLGGYTLPLICSIDPNKPKFCIDRTTSLQTIPNTLDRLQKLVQQVGTCSTSSKAWIYKSYLGYYGRCPDQEGLTFWCRSLGSANGDLGSIISGFGTSEEYTARFNGLTDSQLIDTLYQSMFSRSVESGGLTYYIGQLNQLRQEFANSHGGSSNGATEYALSKIALDILGGASGMDVTTLNGKISACPTF
ncbi:hypothetical protein CCP4SC76_7230010 [Gammaproteobacteria bacterium]